MRRAVPSVTLLLGLLLAAIGCGSGDAPTTTSSSSTGTTGRSATPAAKLEGAVRSAVEMNARLSSYVLWHNAVPTWAARSTSGPALKSLRRVASEGRSQGRRWRTLSQEVAVIRIALDPSYTSATAKVRERGSIVQYRRGHQAGKPVRLDEAANVELRRSGGTPSFVVWKVVAVK